MRFFCSVLQRGFGLRFGCKCLLRETTKNMAHKTPLKTVALAPEMEVGQGALEDGEVMTMAILEEQIAELKLEAVTTVEVLNNKLQEEKRRHADAKKALEEQQAKRKLEGERFKGELWTTIHREPLFHAPAL